jgi:hypothetical protein
MSFALEFRKNHLSARAAPVAAPTKRRRARSKSADRKAVNATTSISGRQVARALMIAGLILAVFNSSALVQYTHRLSDNIFGPEIIIASEKWHALMETGRMTEVSQRIRTAVATARASSWHDIGENLGLDVRRISRSGEPDSRSNDGIITSAPQRPDERSEQPIRSSIADGSG